MTVYKAPSWEWKSGGIAVSPDGRGVAVAFVWSPGAAADPVADSGTESQITTCLMLLVIDADGPQRHLVGLVPAMHTGGFRFLWSSDSRRLYELVPGASSGPGVLRWQEGDPFGQMIELPTTAWVRDAAVLPGEHGLLLWGYDRVLVADRSGVVRDLPDPYLCRMSGGHDLIGVDQRGRAVVTPWPLAQGWPDELKLADLVSGKIDDFYP
jgi:hypothetical protein